MTQQSTNKIRLGFFVLTAITCLILGLYFIGSKRNIFHSTINVSSSFNNVGGLLPGNNVRFNGINVGTVSKIYPISDTTIRVEFTIDKSTAQFIGKTDIASIGTDGLLGNKIINISPGNGKAGDIQEGDTLLSLKMLQMDNVFRTLSSTNDNLNELTNKLMITSDKINGSNSLWKLLSDSVIGSMIKSAIVRFKIVSDNTAILSGDLSQIAKEVKTGKGTFGALLTDTSLSTKLNHTAVNIEAITDSLALVSGNFRQLLTKIENKQGTVGTLITDTAFAKNLSISMENIKNASNNFNENMEALKHTWLLRKYFQKQSKAKSARPKN